ncbi:MAG TPA: hypothetical protein VF452_09820 [Candidatus Binatia bacterium]
MAKKKNLDESLKRGLEELGKAGVSPDGEAATQVRALKNQFGIGRERDLAVIYSLGKIADRAAVAALDEIDRETGDKGYKKEIKRALFKLSQRGLHVARESAAYQAAPAGLFTQEPEIEAYMSAVDGGGGRLIWLAKTQPGHGLQVLQAMLHDRDGLLRIGGAHMRRKEMRNMFHELQQQHNVRMIAIPWEFADWAIYEGYEKARARGQSGLEKFHELRSIVGSEKPKQQIHPVYQKIDAAVVREGAWREQSRRLLDEPELRYWVLTDDWMQQFLTQIQEAQTSRLVLNPLQKEERMNAIVREAVRTLCSGENGRAFKRRMEDMALYFAETQRSEAAKLSLAVALQVAEGDPGPLDVSFLTGLVQKSFAVLLSQEKAKEEEDPSSLIVKP